ncbi:hypothetical protein NON00_13885 [Roseomonas sp. GC11]|uniref:hypothetical protein n=1 Tax=Roseomonas sp. GC11 TaxID=2950546 RepID=UPI00210A8428|nr:hypothetical protein [Roseomonas sp. GC11]MCQ4161011.1 hypothetical protein [Roseomonas sp. GC11]
MISQNLDRSDAGLVLAAEEWPQDSFVQYHSFTTNDESVIRKLIAHGPVLIRGGRGSGKSALLLEAHRRMQNVPNILPVYVSLRYLPLLQADGNEYIRHFCDILSEKISSEIQKRRLNFTFGECNDESSLKRNLSELSQNSNRRIVLLFDDPAHIGREKSLEVFFDLFRTISSSLISCKAAIYPGVTKFGIRFDVFNDSTLVDITRSDVSSTPNLFPEVMRLRYPRLSDRSLFSDRLLPDQFANLLGRAVVGNMRGFILACNKFQYERKIGIPQLNKSLLELSTDHFWPLMEEVAPKLGVYEPLVEGPARSIMEALCMHIGQSLREKSRLSFQDKVLIHRNIISKYSKIMEILEYLGFVSKREASRAMRSGGRGPVFAMNICSLLEFIPTQRLTLENIRDMILNSSEPAEIHTNSNVFKNITLPDLDNNENLSILSKEISFLQKSKMYPYGLTNDMIQRLTRANLHLVSDLASISDTNLLRIEGIGRAKMNRIKNVVYQAIWM